VEEDSDDDEDESDDDEIIMPEGPPPPSDDGSDDSDDIPLPPGPPPPKSVPAPPSPSGPSRLPHQSGGIVGFRPPFQGQNVPYTPQAVPVGMGLPFRPPAHMQNSYRPPMRPFIPHDQPPSIQDPLSDAPTQTYQGHRMAQHDLPVRPQALNGSTSAPPPSASIPSASLGKGLGNGIGEISAAPVLRDLRKEAVAFVPRGVKRKKAGPTGITGGINSAPGAGEVDADGDERKRGVESGGGLLGKLKGVLANSGANSGGAIGATSGKVQGGGDDDYQDFLKGLGELG
jgi:hypothetical protein